MSRERIAEGLSIIVLNLANHVVSTQAPDGWSSIEWAYVKGIASGEILRLRDRLVATS